MVKEITAWRYAKKKIDTNLRRSQQYNIDWHHRFKDFKSNSGNCIVNSWLQFLFPIQILKYVIQKFDRLFLKSYTSPSRSGQMMPV